MGTDNWIIDNLNNALKVWSDAISAIWNVLTQSPQTFHDGAIWNIMTDIHDGLKAIAYALLVLFFVIGVVKTTTNFAELKRPEQALKLFIRFAVAKIIVTYSLDLLIAIFRIVQGVITSIGGSAPSIVGGDLTLPEMLQTKILECGFFDSIPLWIVGLIAWLMIAVISIILLLTVYSRFFTLYMYTAIAPIPLASFAGEGTSQMGKQFLKSYAGVCLRGAIVIIACIIYSVFASTPPTINDPSLSAPTIVSNYFLELIFNMLILVGAVRMADRTVKEMIGF